MKRRNQKNLGGKASRKKRNPIRNTKRGAIARRSSGYGMGRRGALSLARRAATAKVAAPKSNGNGEKVYIYGKHALMEALAHAPHAVRRVFLSSDMDDAELRALIKKSDITPGTLKSSAIGQMVGRDTTHQGVVGILNTNALMVPFDRFMESLKEKASHREERSEKDRAPIAPPMLVLLDELTDPHNVGAIIRSAAAFGADGVLIPSHRQAPVTGAVVKTSAGMAFRVPLIAINNVNQAIDTLKKEGFATYGLAMEGARNMTEEPFAGPSLIIIGNEGEGIREHTLERCDAVLRIPMDARAESLNASVSAAVALYQWSINHPPTEGGKTPDDK